VELTLFVLYLPNQQLTRAGGFAHGRLVNRLSDEPASSWLVTFEDQEIPDEEIHEDDLGPVVARVDDSDNSGSKNGDKSKVSKKKPLRAKLAFPTKPGDVKAGPGSDDAKSLDSNKKKRRSPSEDFEAQDSQTKLETDVSSPNDSSKNTASGVGGKSKLTSDREARSRRRQLAIEDEVPGSGLLKPGYPRPVGPPLHLAKKAKTQGGEAVVKIPMLTGTLYLYRGAKRRVAFIRKL
jgi:hypothetical protein